MSEMRAGWLRSAAGYTVTEALTVVAAMGIVSAFAVPNVLQLKAALEVQQATVQVAGALQRTRARAVAEGVPYLFLVQQEAVGEGSRGTFALIVRDSDRSYSVTPPDQVETFALDPDLPEKIQQYGSAPEPIYPDIPRACTDASAAYDASRIPGTSEASSASSSSAQGGITTGIASGSNRASERAAAEPLADAVTNGSTLPAAEDSGTPGLAFNERGIPVSLDSPGDWGSGAGAIYLTDNEGALYASVISPLGEVSTSRYDAGGGSWK
jgi:type II secretory pathway pseudopilin PulG